MALDIRGMAGGQPKRLDGDPFDTYFQQLCNGLRRLVAPPPRNMFTFLGETGQLRGGIESCETYSCPEMDPYDRVRCTDLRSRIVGTDSNGDPQYWDMPGRFTNVVNEDVTDPPVFDRDGSFFAGTAVKFGDSWSIKAPQTLTHGIVRVETGLWENAGSLRCDDHGIRGLDKDWKTNLMAIFPDGRRAEPSRCAVVRMIIGTSWLVKGGISGRIHRLVMTRDGPQVVSAVGYAEVWPALS